jgi:zinc transport system ATP-binding protein
MSTALQVRDGSVALGGRPVLRGIDLALGEGEVVALLGSNGSGKSTLVRATLGLVPLARGSVELFGAPLARFSSWHRVGYVPQRLAAGAGVPATVWEVVASGRLARRGLLRPLRRADRAAISDALDAVELGDRRHDSASALSGGQQQRVLIARALAGEPDLFFLDEPTAGVDLPNQQVLADTLARLKERGATIVLVAHELGPLARLVDRAVVMRDGRVVYDGAPLLDHEVHQPWLGEPHTHHHHHDNGRGNGAVRPDHVPGVASPVDRIRGQA